MNESTETRKIKDICELCFRPIEPDEHPAEMYVPDWKQTMGVAVIHAQCGWTAGLSIVRDDKNLYIVRFEYEEGQYGVIPNKLDEWAFLTKEGAEE
jgi:hypothetical protein